jgi:nitrate/TMAO reductase-like tetraheme cytochrome c subunit
MNKRTIFINTVILVGLILGLRTLFAQEEKAPSIEKATYVGIEVCKRCHAKEYQDYQKRKFKKAWRVLEMRGKTKDPECVKCHVTGCHVTGYGEPGGFVDEETTPHLKYKQCEACHGPGSLHVGNPGDPKIRESMKAFVHKPNTCTDCHRGVIAHRIGVKEY